MPPASAASQSRGGRSANLRRMPARKRRDRPAGPRAGPAVRPATPPARTLRTARTPANPAPPLPLTHPAVLLAIAAAAAAIVLSVSFRLADTDLWQLLVVGKATWSLHRIPTTDLWAWPHHGAPQVASSWLFRALLWPLWDLGGVAGLYAWRWASTLAAFALVWA